jgi:hypothetical protein
MTDTELRALLEDVFPIESYYFSLTWVPDQPYERPPSAEPDDVYEVLRLRGAPPSHAEPGSLRGPR